MRLARDGSAITDSPEEIQHRRVDLVALVGNSVVVADKDPVHRQSGTIGCLHSSHHSIPANNLSRDYSALYNYYQDPFGFLNSVLVSLGHSTRRCIEERNH
jgi:hypothetical protein